MTSAKIFFFAVIVYVVIVTPLLSLNDNSNKDSTARPLTPREIKKVYTKYARAFIKKLPAKAKGIAKEVEARRMIADVTNISHDLNIEMTYWAKFSIVARRWRISATLFNANRLTGSKIDVDMMGEDFKRVYIKALKKLITINYLQSTTKEQKSKLF